MANDPGGKLREQVATNITWHWHRVTRKEIESLHGHKGATIWFTGLSASGKSTLANAVAYALYKRGVHTFVLDGDNVRHGLNKDLGFTPDDRVENVRRIGEVAKLFTAAGIINMAAFISPYEIDREIARALQPDTFFLVHCDAPVEVCEARDPKGVYKRARAGQIKGFTGVDAPYEAPAHPDLRVDTAKMPVEACVDAVLRFLEEEEIIEYSGLKEGSLE
jgi:adenylylsulfate kinase